MTEYYDAVLGLIPVALVGIAGALTIAGVEPTTAVPLGALVSVGLIGHAMFVNGPVDSVETDDGVQAQVQVDATTGIDTTARGDVPTTASTISVDEAAD